MNKPFIKQAGEMNLVRYGTIITIQPPIAL